MLKEKPIKSFKPLQFSNHKAANEMRKTIYQLIKKYGDEPLQLCLVGHLWEATGGSHKVYVSLMEGKAQKKGLRKIYNYINELIWVIKDISKGKPCTYDELAAFDHKIISCLVKLLKKTPNYFGDDRKIYIDILEQFNNCYEKVKAC